LVVMVVVDGGIAVAGVVVDEVVAVVDDWS
jgi:hypothetical protein